MNSNDQPDYIVRINGRQVDPSKATISIFDHGFLFGDSIYEVIRTIGDRPFAWAAHLARLRSSAKRLSYDLPWTDEEITSELRSVIDSKTWPGESYVRIIITRGPGLIDLHPRSCGPPTMIFIGKQIPVTPEELYANGMVLCVTDVRRNSRLAMDPAIKSGNYLNNVLAAIEAAEKGTDDAVMLNENDHVTECTTSNIFIVFNGVVKTPSLDSGILAGITRNQVLHVAELEGIPAQEALLTLDDLKSADEIFITGTVRMIMPVRKIIGKIDWEAGPGPITRRLMDAFVQALGAEDISSR